jgi:formylglycine-generating enzyme required for sulfatase activity
LRPFPNPSEKNFECTGTAYRTLPLIIEENRATGLVVRSARIFTGVAKFRVFCYGMRMGLFSRRRTIEILAEDEVRFRPILGIRPEVYVPAFWGLVLVVVLFLLLGVPALVNPGSVVAFQSEPLGAAVYVDGVYAGQTPCNVFVGRGEREILWTMGGFHDENAAITVKNHRPGASLRREAVSVTLAEVSPNAALLAGAREAAAWSFTLEPVEVYQIPLVLSEGAYRSGVQPNNEAAAPEQMARAKEIVTGAARFTRSRAGLKDLVRAMALSGNGGNAPSPLSLVSSAQDALHFLQDNPESAAWLAAVLPSGARNTVVNSPWYEAAVNAVDTAKAAKRELYAREANAPATAAAPALTAENVTFVQVRDGLRIAAAPVTETQFARFTEANPEWRGENAETLAVQGLATADYLIRAERALTERAPTVSGVSWYAAEAYCRWLTSRLPASLSGWVAALPTEAQWEAASFVPTVTDLGTVWEWCADPYAPFPAFQTDEAIITEIGSPEKLVRGASWVKPPPERERLQYLRDARGSAPPESSTPFVSFRPVLVREK